jgi:hypothetical protein
MYMIVSGKDTYIRSLKKYSSCMYANVKGKPMYTKQGTDKARVNPRNAKERKNKGYQGIGDMETQERREKRKEKNTQYPPKRRYPQWNRQFYYEENLSMDRKNYNK